MTQHRSSTLQITTPSEREMTMTRVFNAPRHLVFDAWTNPEHLPRWFGRRGDEMIVCDIDLRVGGTWRVVWRLREGGEMGMHGEYREIDRPARLVSTETFEGEFTEVMGTETINTLVLEERDGKTTMTSTSLYKSQEDRDRALATGMETGAAETFDRLEELLQTITA